MHLEFRYLQKLIENVTQDEYSTERGKEFDKIKTLVYENCRLQEFVLATDLIN